MSLPISMGGTTPRPEMMRIVTRTPIRPDK